MDLVGVRLVSRDDEEETGPKRSFCSFNKATE